MSLAPKAPIEQKAISKIYEQIKNIISCSSWHRKLKNPRDRREWDHYFKPNFHKVLFSFVLKNLWKIC